MVFDIERIKLISSATETIQNAEIVLVKSLSNNLSNKQIRKTLIRLRASQTALCAPFLRLIPKNSIENVYLPCLTIIYEFGSIQCSYTFMSDPRSQLFLELIVCD